MFFQFLISRPSIFFAAKTIPKFEIHNKFKKKFLEIPEFKRIDTLIANSKYKFNPKFRSQAEQNEKLVKSLENFARVEENPQMVALQKVIELPEVEATKKTTSTETSNTANKELQEEELIHDPTETPEYGEILNVSELNTMKYQTNLNEIPDLYEFESKMKKQNQKKYDDDESYFGENGDDFVLVKDNDFKDITINLLKAGMSKRSIDDKTVAINQIGNAQPQNDVDRKKMSWLEKIQNETSTERGERLNRALEKLMRVVTVFGQMDNFLTTRTRDVIQKLALMYDYDEKKSQNRRKRYYFDD